MYIYSISVKNKFNEYFKYLYQMTFFTDYNPMQLAENQR